jgi:CheY-like chemotaxis protein
MYYILEMSGRMKDKLAEMNARLTATNSTNFLNTMHQLGTNYFYYYPYSRSFRHCPLYDSEGDESSRGYYYHRYHESPPNSHRQSQEPNPAGTRTGLQEQPPFLKRILVVDDEPDVSLTFKSGLEGCLDNKGRKMFEVHLYDNPLKAVSEFRSNYYDLLLTDIYMPDMNGFQLSQKILELDINIRICYVSATDVNISALRELYPALSLGCFITKPVEVEYLVKRLSAELD